MKVLVIGGGGREHALGWKIEQSPLVEEVIFAPGNAGTEMLSKGRNINIKPSEIEKLGEFCLEEEVDFVVVGPEEPLVKGIANFFEVMDIPVFGPSQSGAMMEESKLFAKKLLKKYRIPTANYRAFQDPSAAIGYISKHGLTKVIKADGLTGGKGVCVYKSIVEAFEFIDKLMIERIHGDAGKTILIENRLKGKEASFQFFTDGKHIIPLETVEDHKPLLDGNKGPNTGGMGAVSPGRVNLVIEQKMQSIAQRLVDAMRKEGIDYRGLCYIGFMIVGDEVYVLEINCRFGDPETQPLMVKMRSDIVPILLACTNGTLDRYSIKWDSRPAACVVLASEGYPESPIKGRLISGLGDVAYLSDVTVFHAGTKRVNDSFVTDGGRVLSVTALGNSLADALKSAYAGSSLIKFEGMQYRRDIGSAVA